MPEETKTDSPAVGSPKPDKAKKRVTIVEENDPNDDNNNNSSEDLVMAHAAKVKINLKTNKLLKEGDSGRNSNVASPTEELRKMQSAAYKV